MRRIFVFTLLLFIGPVLVLLQSCDNPCGGISAADLTSDGLAAEVMEVIGYTGTSTQYLDLSGIDMDDVLPFDSVAFLIEGIQFDQQAAWSIPGSAYACSPVIHTDQVSSIRIISDQPYNQNYPAGADLSPIFEVREFEYLDGSSIDEFLAYDRDFFVGQAWTFTLLEAPDEEGTFDFTFVYSTLSEVDLEVTTTVTIRPE